MSESPGRQNMPLYVNTGQQEFKFTKLKTEILVSGSHGAACKSMSGSLSPRQSPTTSGPAPHHMPLTVTDQHEFKFTKIELRKTETLGSGSYGAVCIAKCDELLCAAKLLFTVLFDMDEASVSPRLSPRINRPHRIPLRRFEQECRFLSQIKHPNIVQYLGTYRDPDSRALVLLMELMDESLTHFLARMSIPLPYYLEVGISHDVAVALAYLHSNNIIHRDLSGNNVLLLHDCRAKVSDFGMSTLGTNPSGNSRTVCPGTPAYMPPEALNETPKYSEMLDSFSFGVVLLQILTREFPNPTDRFTAMKIPHPQQPNVMTEAKFDVPEKVRRKEHIDVIRQDEPLLHIVLDCLSDKEPGRPSASTLCLRLEALKASHRYIESHEDRLDLETVERKLAAVRQDCERQHKEQLEEMEEQIENLVQEVQSKDDLLKIRVDHLNNLKRDLSAKEGECESLRLAMRYDVELQEKERALEGIIEQKSYQVQHVQQQIDLQDQTVHDLHSVIHRHEQSIAELRTQLSRESERNSLLLQKLSRAERSGHSSERTVGVDEEEGDFEHPGMFIALRQQHDAARKDKEIAELKKDLESKETYIQALERQVQMLRENSQIVRDSQINLTLQRGPNAPSKMFGSSATSIGSKAYFRPNGSEIYEFCADSGEWNQLLSCTTKSSTLVVIDNMLTVVGGTNPAQCLSLHSSTCRWRPMYPSMQYGRYNSTAIKCGGYLVVAGGISENGRFMPKVEVLRLSTKQWVPCASLPFSLHSASGVAINDTLYLLGGFNNRDGSLRSVLSCSLKDLVSSSVSSSGPARPTSAVWQRLADLPYRGATCVSAQGHLFAIGGQDRHSKVQSAIYTYNTSQNSWDLLTQLKAARSDCLVSVITTNSSSKLVIVGGYTDNGLSDSVEIASVCT